MTNLVSRVTKELQEKIEMIATRIAKALMLAFEVHPRFRKNEPGERQEIFNHEFFRHGNDSERESIMRGSSEAKYTSEISYPWDNYFGFPLRPLLQGKTALDLGCFTGGRSIAWLEKFGLGMISGVDVDDVYIEAANRFASLRGANAEFRKGTAEALPFSDESFDAVLSFDVFEHVRNVAQALNECHRVLKPGGKLLVVFPSYWHPIEHHLGLVSSVPCIHWVFGGDTLIAAYWSILVERGKEASWYMRSSPRLESWEKGNTINGTTFSQFKYLVSGMNWKVVTEVHRPLGSIGRNISANFFAKAASKLLYPLTFVPMLREFVLHRVTFVLEKPI